MGGVAGHMSHLYDNRDLTFQKMKEILEAASEGDLDAEEKVDGQNLFLSYSLKDNEARSARNKGNLKEGGMNATELAHKFAGRGVLADAFNEGFSVFEKAVNSLSDQEKLAIFGPDANIWYNAEIMDPRSPNVINYDSQVLKIHDAGHFEFDRETGKKHRENVGKNLQILDSKIEQLQDSTSEEDFDFVRRAVTTLEKLDNEVPLQRAVSQINSAIHAENLNDDATMGEYLYQRVLNGIDTDLPVELKEEITKYLLNLPGKLNLRVIKKGLSKENLADLVGIINNKKSILQQAVYPIEKAIHDFTVEVLKGIQSRFIVDSGSEITRLQTELATAVRAITEKGAEDPETMEIMQQHLNKIGDMTNINTPVEGVVFDYDGHTYKFTGNFAPLNQILGMFKYGRSPKLKKESKENNNLLERDSAPNLKREKAEKFVLSLPKFTPSEAWGDPESMERKQIQKIFDTVGGGATIEEKLNFLNDSITNPKGGITSTTRIISTLILMESLCAVIRSFNAASAGFVFEGFLAALFRGAQEAEVSEKGNLPIQDLIAFSELGEEGEYSVPISLKLLNQTTNIEGSYTNLIDALDEFGHMVYIVARKSDDKKHIVLEKFSFTRDNFVDAISLTAKGGRSKEQNLFMLPGYNTVEKSLNMLNSIQGDSNWDQKYELLKQTAGYRNRKKAADAPDDKVTVSDEMPDGPDVESEENPPATKENPPATKENPPVTKEKPGFEDKLAALRSKRASMKKGRRTENIILTVDANRQLLKEELLLESSQTQWAISPAQLKSIKTMVDYDKLGQLPISTEAVIDVAEGYIDLLHDELGTIFQATANLSENINEYFTYQDRSDAISSGNEAINNANTVSEEMAGQLEDKDPANVKESLIKEQKSRRIALFPGKFKPPHRGHLEAITNIADRSDVDEVRILISPRDYPEVSAKQSLAIWNKYLESAPNNIGVEIADYVSPVTATYEFLSDPTETQPGDTVLLVKSSKDEESGDSRFKGAKSWAERKNPGISVEEIVEDPIVDPAGIAYSAEDIRKLISSDKKEEFTSYLPSSVDADQIWSIVKPTSDLDREIDDVVDEISTMGGGAVSGFAGGFGPPNTYNPYQKRNTTKRPKVKRAKRQRRR